MFLSIITNKVFNFQRKQGAIALEDLCIGDFLIKIGTVFRNAEKVWIFFRILYVNFKISKDFLHFIISEQNL